VWSKRAINALVDQKLPKILAKEQIILVQVLLNAQHLQHYSKELVPEQLPQLPKVTLQTLMEKPIHARTIMEVFVLAH
jgi:hypothetical protein